MNTRFDITTVAAALAARTTEVATALLGEANRQLSSKRELRFGRKGSLAVLTRGKKAGWWYDHENGVGGDLINLIEHVQGVSFREAVNLSQRASSVRSPRDHRWRGPLARLRLMISQLDIDTAPVSCGERRCRSRTRWRSGISRGEGLSDCLPALMAQFSVFTRPVRSATSGSCACSRSCEISAPMNRAPSIGPRSPNGEENWSHGIGPEDGRGDQAVRRRGRDDAGLVVGEGLETVLSAMQLGFCPAWALGDARLWKTFPVLSGIDCITIIVDHDENGTGRELRSNALAAGQKRAARCFALFPTAAATTSTTSFKGLSHEHTWTVRLRAWLYHLQRCAEDKRRSVRWRRSRKR